MNVARARALSGLPSLSVVIPTKDRPADLELTIHTLFRQSVAPQRVVIIDQSESNESRRRVEKEYANAQPCIRQTTRLFYITDTGIPGAAAARNRGMEIAAGDVWLFLDDDVCLAPNFLEELLVAYIDHPHLDGVSGIITNYRAPSWPFRCWTRVFTHGLFRDERQPIYWKADRLRDAAPIPVRTFTSALMSFRASVIRGLRFDPDLRGCPRGEDVDFCLRLRPGAALAIAPRARLVHSRSPTARLRDHWIRGEVEPAYYLNRRGHNRGLRNWLLFAWLNTGFALLATAASLRRLSLEPWRALIAGARDGSGGQPGRGHAHLPVVFLISLGLMLLAHEALSVRPVGR